jgi:hypothetical protein
MTPDHHWTVLSRHPTSEGTVVYESCHCGVQRMRQVVPETRSVLVSRPLARPVPGPSTAGGSFGTPW